MLLTWGLQVSTPTFWTERWAKIQAKAVWKAPDSTSAARTCLLDLCVGVGVLSPVPSSME